MKKSHVYYTPMSKRNNSFESEKKIDESEFPSLTKYVSATTSVSATASTSVSASVTATASAYVKPILNFLEAAKKPQPPEEDTLVHSENKSDSDNDNDTKNEPIIFKKGLSFD